MTLNGITCLDSIAHNFSYIQYTAFSIYYIYYIFVSYLFTSHRNSIAFEKYILHCWWNKELSAWAGEANNNNKKTSFACTNKKIGESTANIQVKSLHLTLFRIACESVDVFFFFFSIYANKNIHMQYLSHTCVHQNAPHPMRSKWKFHELRKIVMSIFSSAFGFSA